MPAFERRALLRDKRHPAWWPICGAARAAATARSTAGLNRSCGVRRVEDASIEQLERSIDLLLVDCQPDGESAEPTG
jgi:hypothetical protein